MSSPRIRTTPFVVVGDYKSRAPVWREISALCGEAYNTIWETWLFWHRQHKSREAVQQYQTQQIAFRRNEIKKQPKSPTPVSKECRDAISDALRQDFHGLNGRVWELLKNAELSRLTKLKSTSSNFPAWQQMLLRRQRVPSANGLFPIPFGNRNGTLFWEQDQQPFLRLRLERDAETGQAAFVDDLQLKVGGRDAKSSASILRKIVDGEYEFKGSRLRFDERKRRWMVDLCWQDNTPREAFHPTPGKIAFLIPHRKFPWALRIGHMEPGRTKSDPELFRCEHEFRPLGNGLHIGPLRRNVRLQIKGRNSKYRYAGGNTRGRGRKRARQPLHNLSGHWNRIVKDSNQNASKKAAEICKDKGVERIFILQPVGDVAETRFLATAGRLPGDETTWEYSALASMAFKFTDPGITVEIRHWDKAGTELRKSCRSQPLAKSASKSSRPKTKRASRKASRASAATA